MRLPIRLTVALLLPLSAHAQGITPGSAENLQDQLHAWIASLGGPQAGLNPQVTAAGDHYALRLPIPGLVGDDTASANLFPLEQGVWNVQAIQLPPDMHFNLKLPEPGNPGHRISSAASVSIGSQQSHAVIDPALNSPSRLDMDLHDLNLRTEAPNQHSRQHIGEYRVSATLQPNPAGGLDFEQTALVAGWSSSSQMVGKPAVEFGADRVTATGGIDGLNRDQAGVLLSAVSGLIATIPAKELTHGPGAKLDPAQRTALRRLVESLRGIITSMHAEEDIEGLHWTVTNIGPTHFRAQGSLNHVHLAFGGNAPNGMLHGWIEIAFNGLSIPSLPPQVAELVPHHVVLRPSLAGVPADAVMQLALDATQPDTNQAELAAEATTLVRKGTTLSLDKLGFDIGPASVQGTGHVTVLGPNEYVGEAYLVATGFDALMQQAQQEPDLQRELPILIMLRGYAKQEGNRLVWKVEAQGGGVTINGMPLIQPHPGNAAPIPLPPPNQK